MSRRRFLRLLSGAAAAWPLVARAQQPERIPVIGFLSSRSPGESGGAVAAFGRGLAEAGFAEGRNAVIAFRWAEGHYERLPALAADLITSRANILVAAGRHSLPSRSHRCNVKHSHRLHRGRRSSPPWLCRELQSAGGNITGISLFNNILSMKRIGLLHELVPMADVVAMLINPKSPILEEDFEPVQETARSLGLTIHVLNASTDRDLDVVFDALPRLRIRGLALQGEPFFDSRRHRIIELAERQAIPTVYAWREYVAAGGLMSYGTNLTDNYRQAGIYVGRV